MDYSTITDGVSTVWGYVPDVPGIDVASGSLEAPDLSGYVPEAPDLSGLIPDYQAWYDKISANLSAAFTGTAVVGVVVTGVVVGGIVLVATSPEANRSVRSALGMARVRVG